MTYFTAIATDLDGTLTRDGRLDASALTALDDARPDVATILVTGRMRVEALAEFPGLEEHFDATVYENGAVLRVGGAPITRPHQVHRALARALADWGVHVRSGEAILACSVAEANRVASTIAALGLDEQLVHNRSELMIVPAGCSKGTGLYDVLRELGISPHNAVAVGDAENDLSMLAAAEIGACVANAVASVRDQADICLPANGAGVTELVARVVRDEELAIPERRANRVGETDDGDAVTVPGARANILIVGDSGAGKSYLTGTMVEQWLVAGYKVLVIDPEGEHAALGRFHHALVVDACAPLDSADLRAALGDPARSIIVDLSAVDPAERQSRVEWFLQRARPSSGAIAPHWTVIDEAHQLEPVAAEFAGRPDRGRGGWCLVTYRPERLDDAVLSAIDVTVTADCADEGRGPRWAVCERRDGSTTRFTLDPRLTDHVRHRRKYAVASLLSLIHI